MARCESFDEFCEADVKILEGYQKPILTTGSIFLLSSSFPFLFLFLSLSFPFLSFPLSSPFLLVECLSFFCNCSILLHFALLYSIFPFPLFPLFLDLSFFLSLLSRFLSFSHFLLLFFFFFSYAVPPIIWIFAFCFLMCSRYTRRRKELELFPKFMEHLPDIFLEGEI